MMAKVVWLLPVGIASVVAEKIYSIDGDLSMIFSQIGLYFMTVMAGLGIHILITLPLIFTAVVSKLENHTDHLIL